MNIHLTALSVVLALVVGCSAEPRKVDPSPSTMGLGDIQKRDPLLGSECKVSCTVSPGPGCC